MICRDAPIDSTANNSVFSNDFSTLGDSYNAAFDVIKADTPALLEQVYKLRYQIYCVENPFEDPQEHLSGLEMDMYDAHAVHYLLIHRASGLAVGTVRMVLPLAANLRCSLPIQSVCSDNAIFSDMSHMRTAAEISRFCISKEMRRRVTDHFPEVNAPENAHRGTDRRVISCMMLGLIRACIETVQEHGIEHSYLICEPTLLRLLTRVGVCSTAIGPMVEYHGLRQPVLINNDTELLQNTYKSHHDIWTVLSDNGRLKPRVRALDEAI